LGETTVVSILPEKWKKKKRFGERAGRKEQKRYTIGRTLRRLY